MFFSYFWNKKMFPTFFLYFQKKKSITTCECENENCCLVSCWNSNPGTPSSKYWFFQYLREWRLLGRLPVKRIFLIFKLFLNKKKQFRFRFFRKNFGKKILKIKFFFNEKKNSKKSFLFFYFVKKLNSSLSPLITEI